MQSMHVHENMCAGSEVPETKTGCCTMLAAIQTAYVLAPGSKKEQ